MRASMTNTLGLTSWGLGRVEEGHWVGIREGVGREDLRGTVKPPAPV